MMKDFIVAIERLSLKTGNSSTLNQSGKKILRSQSDGNFPVLKLTGCVSSSQIASVRINFSAFSATPSIVGTRNSNQPLDKVGHHI